VISLSVGLVGGIHGRIGRLRTRVRSIALVVAILRSLWLGVCVGVFGVASSSSRGAPGILGMLMVSRRVARSMRLVIGLLVVAIVCDLVTGGFR